MQCSAELGNVLRFLWLLLLCHAKELRDFFWLLLGTMQSKAQVKGGYRRGEMKIKADKGLEVILVLMSGEG